MTFEEHIYCDGGGNAFNAETPCGCYAITRPANAPRPWSEPVEDPEDNCRELTWLGIGAHGHSVLLGRDPDPDKLKQIAEEHFVGEFDLIARGLGYVKLQTQTGEYADRSAH